MLLKHKRYLKGLEVRKNDAAEDQMINVAEKENK